MSPLTAATRVGVIGNMGDNIEPNNYHAVETPSAEHLSDPAADGSAPSVGTPTTSGSEGTDASPGVLQVISSPGDARGETWNSFLDVGPVLALQTFTSASLVLTLHADSTETFRRRQDLKGKSIDVSIRSSNLHLPINPHLDRAFEPFKGLQANQHHGVCRSIMLKTRRMTHCLQLEAADGYVSSGAGVRIYLLLSFNN